MIGAGLYADSQVGAATATGIGELAIRTVISRTAVEMMKDSPAEEAGVNSVRLAGQMVGKGTGLITLDRRGNFGAAHDTSHLCWASMSGSKTEAHMTGTKV